jgi:hypothetical protein
MAAEANAVPLSLVPDLIRDDAGPRQRATSADSARAPRRPEIEVFL